MNRHPHKQRPFAAVVVAIVTFIVRILFRVTIEGKENLPTDRGYVCCSNHLSFLDPVFWIVSTKKRIRYMAKAELFKNKLFSWFFKQLSAFPVDREGGSASSVAHAIDIVKEGGILGIFPEGTRSKDGKPGRAKSGAAYIANATGADVIPMAIIVKGKIKVFSKVHLIIGKPIKHEEIHFEGTDRKGLRNASTKIMQEIVTLWENGHNEF